MSLAALALAALAGIAVSLRLNRVGLVRLAVFLGLLAFGTLFLSRAADGGAFPGAASLAWWAMLGFAAGFTAVSLLRSGGDLLGRH
ncbi:MAG: hypothetical protein H0U65_04170 [Rubrobacter sp.]|nr:hypothetical protein [Rubrobacter sp.]